MKFVVINVQQELKMYNLYEEVNVMYLSFDQKRSILQSYPELIEVPKSNNRYSYFFEDSKQPRKVVARELSPTGNGYVYGAYLKDHSYVIDARGWIRIKDFSESELRELVEKAIQSFR